MVRVLIIFILSIAQPIYAQSFSSGSVTGGSFGSGSGGVACNDGIDNDGDGLIDWIGNDGGGDPGCPTPDWNGGECTDPECAPDPDDPGVGLASLPDSITAWPGSFTAEGEAGCPSTLVANGVYQYCAFSGQVFVDVDNVTLYGCRIRSTGDSAWGIRVEGGDNLRVLYTRVEPANDQTPPISYSDGYQYGMDLRSTALKSTVQSSHFVGYGNAVSLDGAICSPTNPCTYRHIVFDFPRENGGIDHTDGIGCLSSADCIADNLTITGDTFLGFEPGGQVSSNTNAIAMQEGDNNTNGYDSLLVTSSYFTGWNTVITLEEGPDNNTNNLIINNWFGTEYEPRNVPNRQWSDSMGTWASNKWNVTSDGIWSYPTSSDDGKFWWPSDGNTDAKHATDYNSNAQVPFPEPACNDGIDNDSDGNIDYPWDSGCTLTTDTSE